ncbi:DNA mismatch repair endonuclease MutL [Vibrio profundum]|uniref:DNA mismatch repair endonuclease MutL n=1 Tax=Vibrio profundum TaxID=2910247 RepID=UPI003D0B688E
MTIKILPARLANQIAAGEVVERPASVVKELVENSLDAGATKIEVDIELGGAKLIRVRDDGKGIDKEQLGLALSRHATSKIHSLDDLDAIVSLGFRGEALASISSVSRLTLTSRPVNQEQAWSAQCEGRDMEVKLQPAAHPVGSTVEVADLFFNTPARRKFLRTEKTEFQHIDEFLKRIALSRFDVSIFLRHNGKVVRQYRKASNTQQTEKRLAAVCGSAFVRSMLHIQLAHQDLKLTGWITSPEGARQQSDLQYCYVNGRVVKDKLINHAIRQSYETTLRADQYATYVLFIDVDPHQVDVNVHPAKHEVRFHQARLIHDFIYQALSDALAQSIDLPVPTSSAKAEVVSRTLPNESESRPPTPDRERFPSVGESIAKSSQGDYRSTGLQDLPESRHSKAQVQTQGPWEGHAPRQGSSSSLPKKQPSVSRQERQVYGQLLATEQPPVESVVQEVSPSYSSSLNKVVDADSIKELGSAIAIVDKNHLLMSDKRQVLLVSLPRVEWLNNFRRLDTSKGGLVAQPLLVPLALNVSSKTLVIIEQCQPNFSPLGIELKVRNRSTVLVMAVPQPLRQQNLQKLIPELLVYMQSLLEQSDAIVQSKLSEWLSVQTSPPLDDYTLSQAIQLIAEFEQLWQGALPLHDPLLVQEVDFSHTLTALQRG